MGVIISKEQIVEGIPMNQLDSRGYKLARLLIENDALRFYKSPKEAKQKRKESDERIEGAPFNINTEEILKNNITNFSKLLAETIKNKIYGKIHIDCIFGPPYSGNALVPSVISYLADREEINYGYSYWGSKDKREKLLGNLEDIIEKKGEAKILMIDDIIVNGNTIIREWKYLKNYLKNIELKAVCVGIDCGLGGCEKIEKNLGVKVIKIVDIPSIYENLHHHKIGIRIPIKDEEYNAYKEWKEKLFYS